MGDLVASERFCGCGAGSDVTVEVLKMFWPWVGWDWAEVGLVE